MIWVGSMVILYLGDWKGFMLFKWVIENDFINFSFLTKVILDDWKWFISRRPKMISSGPFMANWEQSRLFMSNTKGFVLFTSDQNDFHHWWLLLLFFSKGSKTISMGMRNYKTICTNHGQLKTIYTIDELLLFISKWQKNFHDPWQSKRDLHQPCAIENNPHCWCFLVTKNDLHRWFIFIWTNKNDFSPFMGNWK
jgi:hypothetical protein